MCEHTVLKNGWDHVDPEIPKPKTADEILMEKCKRIRAKLDGDIAEEKKRRESKDYMNVIKDSM